MGSLEDSNAYQQKSTAICFTSDQTFIQIHKLRDRGYYHIHQLSLYASYNMQCLGIHKFSPAGTAIKLQKNI